MSRFQWVLEANALTGLADVRKKALFLSYCGPEVIDMAEALSEPETLKTVTWMALQDFLQTHYAPIPSPMVYKHEFYHRKQQEGETINQYVAALRKAVAHCEFSNIEESMMDRLMFRLRDLRFQRRLLSIPKLDFKKALEDARASKATDKTAAAIQKAENLNMPQSAAAVH